MADTEQKWHMIKEVVEDLSELLKPYEQLIISPGGNIQLIIKDTNLLDDSCADHLAKWLNGADLLSGLGADELAEWFCLRF
jgi:hypothetical protein